MKPKINRFWGYLTIGLVILTLILSIVGHNRGVLLVRTDAEPQDTAETFFESIVVGKNAEAEACLENYSGLGLEGAAASERGRALLSSYDYALLGEPERKGDTAVQSVSFRYLDLNALEADLAEPVAVVQPEGEDPQPIYPSLEELLAKAEKYYTTAELQVTLHYSEGQWRIVADESLLSALAGGK